MNPIFQKELDALDQLIDNLPSRVNETPKEVLKSFLLASLQGASMKVVKDLENKDFSFWFNLIEDANRQTDEEQMDSYCNNANKLRETILATARAITGTNEK